MKFVGKAVLVALVLLLSACSSVQRVKERFTVDLRAARVPAGMTEAEFDAPFSKAGLTKGDIEAVYFPADDAVCLKFRHNFTTHYLFWNRMNRMAFTAALRAYKTEYEQRSLAGSNLRNKRKYGTERAYLIWETSQYSVQGIGHPNVELGYQFKKDSPYFSITLRETPNEDDVSKGITPQSSNMVVYFIREQADAIAALFDQAYLDSLRPAQLLSPPPVETDFDSPYTEGEF